MKQVRVQAKLVAIGAYHEALPDSENAVFSCSAEAARKLGVAIKRDVELSVLFTESAGPQGSGLGIEPARCPCCGADVALATVQVPALMRVYVEPDVSERVAEYADGHLAILPSYRLHAERCPKWPDKDRDWRSGCR